MKIGILTFHWATNYGAVIQSYALQQYLISKYPHDIIEIINYVPMTPKRLLSNVKAILTLRIIGNMHSAIKERRINDFRQEHLILSDKYNSYEELKNANSYDVLICGSDQIWNPWFTKNGEGKQTLSYFLGFSDCKKIAYAASFGCTSYPKDLQDIVKSQLDEFSAISVRETSAISILKNMGVDKFSIVADPSMLVDAELYDRIAETGKAVHTTTTMFVLHKKPKIIFDFFREIKKTEPLPIKSIDYRSLPDWLCAIKNTNMLITNSFHALMICLKYHTNFMIILEKGIYEGMNDRFSTILDVLDLKAHVLSNYTIDEYKKICNMKINWIEVDKRLESYVKQSKEFLINALPKN